MSIPKFMVWREQTEAFRISAVYEEQGPGVNLTGGDRPEHSKASMCRRTTSGYSARRVANGPNVLHGRRSSLAALGWW